MKLTRPILIATLVGSLSVLTACGANPNPADDKTVEQKEEKSFIARSVEKGINEAKVKIDSENISVSHGFRFNNGAAFSTDDEQTTKAEITPKGDFLIDGKAVAISETQRALLLAHRAQIIAIAKDGMDIGIQGADLAGKAISESLKGIFSGETDQVEQRVEAEAEKIKASALKLCERLPGMLASQQKLKVAVPEFAPYATMKQDDIDDCGKETRDDKARAQQQKIRDDIRNGIRGSIRNSTQEAGLADKKSYENEAAKAQPN